jgi:outer membrane lipoprotein SlyB
MKWISVDSIVELRKVKNSKFWKGAGIGFVTGAAAGALIGWATYEKPKHTHGMWDWDFGPGFNTSVGAILGAPVGFLLGGIIGSYAGKDEIYNFSQMSYQQKLIILGWLVSNQK